MKLRFLAILCISLWICGCNTYEKPPAAFHGVLVQPYKLEASDQIRITVYGQSDLTNTYMVDQDGNIFFPLIGQVPAKGHTQAQLAALITRKLKAGYIREPDVSVEVAQYRPIFVMGEVSSSGQYPFIAGMTAQNAIATAGGFTSRANQRDIDITRQIDGKIFSARTLITDPLRPGDTIYVRERFF
ncbi:polysaccharide biosynthesis/export family protein [Flexibacterium corallicola]|uniref:polysaccharide biosynthesis/export family protein n=1 Tax=Flexibacterium corallicola TaxID=3037259 RepID=UPI00286F12D1|nr:polysaccharide biosynthesis/export family protein [Pseudovibrio sp. M1P-2-3]